MLNSWVEGIVGNYSADGIRIDTVKHIRKDFWSNFSSSAGVYAIGEVLNNVTSYVSDYTRTCTAHSFSLNSDLYCCCLCRGTRCRSGLPDLVSPCSGLPDSIR
jgi:hypothetical protein